MKIDRAIFEKKFGVMLSDSFGVGGCGCKIYCVIASSQLEADEAMVKCMLLKYQLAVI
jgi:hypothetical protein